jgi:hypothetical protein
VFILTKGIGMKVSM